jgi:hypothetical protein
MLPAMTDAEVLAWIAAAGSIAATAGAWRTEATARWQARVERLRADAARRENELHRRRLAEVWHWWHDMPDGPERVAAARWYSEWTGAAAPFRGGKDSGPQPPGFGCADDGDAYERYVGFLGAVYEPGRLGAPRGILRRAPALLRRRSLRAGTQDQERGGTGAPDGAPL